MAVSKRPTKGKGSVRPKAKSKSAGKSGESDVIEQGVLIRGADGRMYFIPDRALRSFKLPEKAAAPARKILEEHQREHEGLAVTTLSAEVTLLPALHGPIGLRSVDWSAVAINPTIPGKILLNSLEFDKKH